MPLFKFAKALSGARVMALLKYLIVLEKPVYFIDKETGLPPEIPKKIQVKKIVSIKLKIVGDKLIYNGKAFYSFKSLN